MKDRAFSSLAILFTVCMVLANILANKMIQIGPITVTAGILVFPITYILNDTIVEVYGYRKATNVIWHGFAANLLMVLFFQLAIMLPSPVWFEGAEAFKLTLGSTARIVSAGLLAYLAGSFINANIMVKLKERYPHALFVRCATSTLFGEFIDSTIFITLAFVGTMPLAALGTMILVQAVFKTLYEFIIYPITRIVIRTLQQT